ncbi:glycosyltransferase [Agromyces archimandritae]|uniref:Glycosyltransferase n=1 Tax=Agromyces archimandritae TaxID=2781962 RepID=A0A975FPH4_9MICO|nr:glycosyltransferase [Agromyces archimandritae]QTX05432.1 glycosyltransferase [Agromyces archimandritae]
MKSTGYFLLIPALSAIAPLLALPVISAAFGIDGWASIAIGLSLGMTAGSVAELGWSVIGPQAVAGGDATARARLYSDSRATKLLSVAVLAPVAGVSAALLTEAYRVEAVVLAVAGAMTALGTSWFFVGLNRPLAVLAVDTVPRVVGVLLAALVIALGGPLIVYPIALLLAAIANSIAAPILLGYRWWPSSESLRAVPSNIRAQATILLGRLVSTGTTSLTVTITAISAPHAVPVFAAYERVMRMTAAFLTGIPSRLQSWLGRATPATRDVRIREVIAANLVLGVLAGTCFAALSPIAIDVLFAGMLTPEPALGIASGVVLALICTSRGVGLALVAIGSAHGLTVAAIGSCIVGVPLLFLLSPFLGPLGAMVAEIAAETVGLTALLGVLLKNRRAGRPRRAPAAGDLLRIAIVADGDPRDLRTNSGVARGLLDAFERRDDLEVTVVVDSTPSKGPGWAFAIAAAFHPSRDVWRRRYTKGALGTRLRSRQRDRRLSRSPQVDLVVHVRNTYRPSTVRYVAFIDGTTDLAAREWPPWSLGERADKRRIGRERRMFEHADVVWTAGAHVAANVVERYGVPPERVFAIGGGTNPTSSGGRSRCDPARRDRTVLFVGRDFERKGGPELLEAFAGVRRRHPDTELLVVGPETADPILPGVTWIGRVDDRSALAEIYESAGVFCLPARYEPYGLVVQEAQANGLVCIVSDVGALPELVGHGAGGVIVPPASPEHLEVAIDRVLGDPALRERLRAALSNLLADRDWDAVADRAMRSLRRTHAERTG